MQTVMGEATGASPGSPAALVAGVAGVAGGEPDDVVATLDAVDRLYSVRVEAEARSFELAAHFADLHAGDGLPTSSLLGAGTERAVQVGGAGTPRIAEFAYAELGARMRMSTWSARRYVADALDVRHRLPLIWAHVRSRQARMGNVRLVATRTRHLSLAAAGYVDAAMADYVDGSLPWGACQMVCVSRVAVETGVTVRHAGEEHRNEHTDRGLERAG
jgi:hypothetical protein